LALIINTHPSKKPGKHWVSIVINSEGFGEYFDLFGLPPLRVGIIQYFDVNCEYGGNSILWPFITQNHLLVVIIVYFVWSSVVKDTHQCFMSKFTEDTLENDLKIIEIFGDYSFSV